MTCFHTDFSQGKICGRLECPNILVQITVKKLTLFPIIFLEYFASFTIFLTDFLSFNIFILYFTYKYVIFIYYNLNYNIYKVCLIFWQFFLSKHSKIF
jgi:hypothetical protein